MPWEVEEELEHHSDARAVTLSLGSGDFRFDLAEATDKNGVVKQFFAEGETVVIHIKTTNHGTTDATVSVSVTDDDTNAVIFDAPNRMKVAKGNTWEYTFEIGSMPKRDWHLRVWVTP